MDWCYFFGIKMVPDRLASLHVDYFILVLCYLSFVSGNEDWCVSAGSLEVVISKETETLIKAYKPDSTIDEAVKEIKSTCARYRSFKYLQRLTNITYARLLLGVTLLLAILSNTLFSNLFVFFLSVLMYN